MHMDWERYYVLFVMCTSIVLALGLEVVIKSTVDLPGMIYKRE